MGGGIGVAEEDGSDRVHVAQHRIELGDYGGHDGSVGVASALEVDLGRFDIQLPEEDALEVVGVVLARPDEDHLHVVILAQLVDDEGGADDVGPDTEDEG